jgi:hypothetical protein
LRGQNGFLAITVISNPATTRSDTSMSQTHHASKSPQAPTIGGWALGKHRQLELKGNSPLHITETTTDKDFITVKLAHSSPFARVHVAASRF